VDSVHTIALPRAIELLAQKKTGAGSLRDLGAHPDDGKPVRIFKGRFGPYIKYGKINATIQPPYEPESITLEQAVEILSAKESKKPSSGRARRAA
jgi:DNA topoisomerase I